MYYTQLCIIGLQSIELVLEEFLPEDEDMGTTSRALFLSKVTGLIALRHMPNLVFNVSADQVMER